MSYAQKQLQCWRATMDDHENLHQAAVSKQHQCVPGVTLPLPCVCCAAGLVRQVVNAAKDVGIPLLGENALEGGIYNPEVRHAGWVAVLRI